ncbi:MAG: calcium-translocating P-type ATPase, PMCA-type [Candidatus Adiutrix sp.]|nr:calcium-translocating P-type ATPase, PMCA-type [Candidatus Adiutrix sp.]
MDNNPLESGQPGRPEFPGLTGPEVLESRRLHGANVLTPPPRSPWWKLYLEKFKDPIIRILLVAAVIALVAGLVEGQFTEGIGIIVALLLATTLGFINEYKAGQEFDVLNQVSDDEPINLIRAGRYTSVPKRELVVGDVLALEQGQEIPADAEVLSSVSFQVSEASLTGESVPVTKQPPAPAREDDAGLAYPRHQLLRGTFVTDGHALARVTAVGDQSEIGQTARAATEETDTETPLNRQLAKLGQAISRVGFSVGGLIFVALSVQAYVTGQLPITPDDWRPASAALELLSYFMVAVTIIVVAVPEGLPMSVTLSLAYSMRKMTAANNLVRRMHACETIGAATVICSDKTGTLTMNQMRVANLDFSSRPEEGGKDSLEWRLTAQAICANSTANLGLDSQGRLTVALGNPTEGALLLWLADHGENYQDLRAGFDLAGQLTFSTERKYMATIGSGLLTGGLTLYVKGAPEIVLSRAKARRRPDGRVEELGPADREALLAALRGEQARGMRALGFAYRLVESGGAAEYSGEKIQALVEEGELVWLGFFAIADPVRPEVIGAVRDCARAGVTVKMVTGDNQATAREIATEIGMIQAGDDRPGLVVTGDEFMSLDDQRAEEVAGSLRIMSRARPLAKQRLVTLLQKRGEVVAVTGDGSNDAPALNHADVGLAMGITGTSVAKEAADIILLDDSFATIVQAVMWGRSLYLNIQRFILFQLTINVAAMGVALSGPFLGIQLPLTVTQMLWVNLIMDTFAALALASEPPDWSVMRQPPRDPEAFIVTPAMAKFIFIVGGLFLALFLGLALGFKESFPMETETPAGRHNLSIFFSVFVFLQFWNLFNARMLGLNRPAFSRLSESKIFMLILAAVGLGQILMTQFGGEVFRTVPLSAREWLWIILGTSPVLWIGEIIRWRQRS